MKFMVTVAFGAALLLAGCDSSNPFLEDEETTDTDTDTDTGTDTDTDTTFDTGGGGTPPGVDGPSATANDALIRYEERDDNGGGYAEDFAYDAATDTFTVDNLAFDGEGPYTRGAAIASLGPNDSYAVYDAEVTVPDALDGDAINQIALYRAIVGLSRNSVDGTQRTSFAIVRTGGYVGYGFGGFVYQRQGSVVMPTTGQATFNGDYAGIRVFNGSGGLEFTQADMSLDIDWDDPTAAVGAVKITLSNREAFNPDGTAVTLGNDGEAGELPLPGIITVLNGDSGNISSDGDLTGTISSVYVDPDGEVIDYEQGTYYGILAGDTTDAADGGEIVGVLVLESTDPRATGVEAQETGGFILYRDGP